MLNGSQHCLVKILENRKMLSQKVIPSVSYLWISQKLLILLTIRDVAIWGEREEDILFFSTAEGK